MSNKLLRTAKPRTAKVKAGAPPPSSPANPKEKVRQLREQMYRLEVEIAAAPRLMQERRRRNANLIPPPETASKAGDTAPARLIHANLLAKQRRQMFLLAEFLVGFILVMGTAAWTYKAWLLFSAK